uniref:Uncharacterized protein n=1 Tax=Tetraselmis sp. GSL018 TaxID=582737 RepID=A0A061SLB1_9CHLO
MSEALRTVKDSISDKESVEEHDRNVHRREYCGLSDDAKRPEDCSGAFKACCIYSLGLMILLALFFNLWATESEWIRSVLLEALPENSNATLEVLRPSAGLGASTISLSQQNRSQTRNISRSYQSPQTGGALNASDVYRRYLRGFVRPRWFSAS